MACPAKDRLDYHQYACGECAASTDGGGLCYPLGWALYMFVHTPHVLTERWRVTLEELVENCPPPPKPWE